MKNAELADLEFEDLTDLEVAADAFDMLAEWQDEDCPRGLGCTVSNQESFLKIVTNH